MIHIHATNLGVMFETTDSTLATAKDFNWSIRLSTEDTSSDKDTCVVVMPDKMALDLFWWYCNKEASNQLTIHLCDLLDDNDMKKAIVVQLEWSVTQLDKARQEKVGRSYYGYYGDMATEIEDHLDGGYENELYALLDEAKIFQV